jgi:hypothetical protein
VTGLGPVLAYAAYAGLLWGVALALDAIGRRSLQARGRPADEDASIRSDVERFHRAIGGAALGVGAFLLVAYVVARRAGTVLLLVPAAAACLFGALRRVVPLWREP